MAGMSRRDHTVEEIDPPLDGEQQILGAPETHQVTRSIGGEHLVRLGEKIVAQLELLSEAEAAVGVAVEADFHGGAGTAPPKLWRISALNDAEQGLVRSRVVPSAALRPAEGALHGRLGAQSAARTFLAIWRLTLVERHRHVRTQRLLDLHRPLRSEVAATPVERRREGEALLVDLHPVGEGGHLEATAVGDPGPAPAGEAVQSAGPRHQLLAGSLVEVVGVGEKHLCAELGEIAGCYAAHRAVGRDGLKGRRLDHTMCRREARAARRSIPLEDFEAQALGHLRGSTWRRRRNRSGRPSRSPLRRRPESDHDPRTPPPAAAEKSAAGGSW